MPTDKCNDNSDMYLPGETLERVTACIHVPIGPTLDPYVYMDAEITHIEHDTG